jgi:hypothetical protein
MSNAVSKESLELVWKAAQAPMRELGRNVDRLRRTPSARTGRRVRTVRPVPVAGRALDDGSVWTVG